MSIFKEEIYRMKDTQLKDYLNVYLKNHGYGKKGTRKIEKNYLFAQGTHPILLVAHLDTVHRDLPQTICYSPDGDYVMSPQGIGGDDRNGVCIILEILKTYHCSVLFTMGEETGGIGAEDFVRSNIPQTLDVAYIVEFDRKGTNDCVFYNLDNPDFEQFVENYGFETDIGSYSDICDIAPAVGAAAVNISSGYFDAHTKYETVSIKAMQKICDQVIPMLADVSQKFKWREKKYQILDYYYNQFAQKNTGDIHTILATPLYDYYICDQNGEVVSYTDELYISKYGEIYYIDNYGYADKLPTDFFVINPDDFFTKPEFDEMYCEEIYVLF